MRQRQLRRDDDAFGLHPGRDLPGAHPLDDGATTTAPGTTTGTTTFNPQEPDSETNDVPPKKGSPEAAFEQQCKANPDACG